MSAGAPEPTIVWNSELGVVGALPVLALVAVGLALLLFPKPLVAFQIRALERQLTRLRERPPLLFLRLFGAAFAAAGVFIFVSLVRAAR